MTPLSLGELVDLEARALEEQSDLEEVRRTRYRQLGHRLGEKGPLPEDPGALLKALLRLDPRPDGLGRRFEAALRILHSALAVLGLLGGGSLSLGLLHGSDEGRYPVNVLTVLAALVGTQLLLLALLLLALIPRQLDGASGPVQHLLRAALARLLRGAGGLEDRLDSHRGLLKWLLVRAAQIFGIAFNVGALSGAFFRLATFDVSFGWSTTFPLSPHAVHRIARLLATPWSWISAGAVPSLSAVEATQYSHLEGKYILHGAGDRSLAGPLTGAWWLFVLLSIAVYGLLPRFLTFALAGARVARILADTPRCNVELARLCEWMRTPEVTTRPEGPEPSSSPAAGSASSPEPALPPSGTACEVLDGAPPAAVQRLRDRLGWTVAPGSDGPLVAVVSAWEEPTKGAVRALAGLRDRLSRRLLVVALFDPGPDGADAARRDRIRARWQRDLPAALDGVQVRVEAL